MFSGRLLVAIFVCMMMMASVMVPIVVAKNCYQLLNIYDTPESCGEECYDWCSINGVFTEITPRMQRAAKLFAGYGNQPDTFPSNLTQLAINCQIGEYVVDKSPLK
nr:unnamed protein product [Callosobruchus chinensis]